MSPDRVTARERVPVVQAEAFRLFTECIGDWYRIDENTVYNPEATVDLRIEGWVGGRFIDVTDLTTGEGNVIGAVSAWQPPEYFQFTDNRGCHVDVRFVPQGSNTEVSVTVSGINNLPPAEADQVRRHSWHTIVGWYAEHASSMTRCK